MWKKYSIKIMFFIFRLLFVAIPLLYLWALIRGLPWEPLLNKGLGPDVNFLLPCFVGIAIFLRIIFSKKRLGKFFIFCDTLEHEFSHILMGFIHFKTPGELKVSDRGNGHITLNNISTLICLAPYIFPLSALTLTVISPLFIEPVRDVISYLTAFMLGNYLFRLKREIHKGQSDFDIAGRYLSYLIIFSTNFLWWFLLFLNWANWVSPLKTWKYFYDFLSLQIS